MDDLDPVIHATVRLKLMAALTALDRGDGLSFPRLQDLLDLTGGNLTTHLRKLEEAGYVEVTRTGAGRGSRSHVAATDEGRVALTRYRQALADILGGG